MSAVVSPQVSFASTLAPASSKTLTASCFPVRDASISAVSPNVLRGAFTSAPALTSRSIIVALPLRAASCIGVAPSRVAADTLAPAFKRRSADSRSSARTAQCSAVVPSIWGTLTSAFWFRRVRRTSFFPRITASATSLPAALAGITCKSNATRKTRSDRVIVLMLRVLYHRERDVFPGRSSFLPGSHARFFAHSPHRSDETLRRFCLDVLYTRTRSGRCLPGCRGDGSNTTHREESRHAQAPAEHKGCRRGPTPSS